MNRHPTNTNQEGRPLPPIHIPEGTAPRLRAALRGIEPHLNAAAVNFWKDYSREHLEQQCAKFVVPKHPLFEGMLATYSDPRGRLAREFQAMTDGWTHYVYGNYSKLFDEHIKRAKRKPR